MLIIDQNSVYEIDEECIKKRKVPEECEVYQKLVREEKKRQEKNTTKDNKTNYDNIEKT